jgi:hypothetical protein
VFTNIVSCPLPATVCRTALGKTMLSWESRIREIVTAVNTFTTMLPSRDLNARHQLFFIAGCVQHGQE